MSPTDEAYGLFKNGYRPVSNRYLLVAREPLGDPAEALARAESRGGDDWGSALYPAGDPRRGKEAMYRQRLKHWQKLDRDICIEQWIRCYAIHKKVARLVYQKLKVLCGANNRGR